MSGCLLDHGDDQAEAEIGYLCLKHFSRLRSTLTELPAVAAWLHVNQAAGGSGLHDRVSGSSEDPIPLRLDVLDLIGPDSRRYAQSGPAPQVLLWEDGVVVGVFSTWPEGVVARWREVLDSDDLDADPRRWQVRVTERGGSDQQGEDSLRATMMHWARLVQEESGFPWTDRNDLTGLVGWLAGHLSWIAAQPWVDEFAADVTLLHLTAHRVAPWREELTWLSDPCSSCGVRAVVAHIGDGWRKCEPRAGGCGKREQLSEYELRVLLPESRRAG